MGGGAVPQCGDLGRAWGGLCTGAEKGSEVHMGVKAALMGEDFEKLKNWQRDALHTPATPPPTHTHTHSNNKKQ